jgi:hypothetical protein
MTRDTRQECDSGANYAIGETGPAAQVRKALILDRDSLRREKAAEQHRVKKFLVGPARKKCGDLVVAHDARRQQVAQVNDRVRLDIHHVGDREQGVVAKPRLGRRPIEAFRLGCTAYAQITIEVEGSFVRLHARYTDAMSNRIARAKLYPSDAESRPSSTSRHSASRHRRAARA